MTKRILAAIAVVAAVQATAFAATSTFNTNELSQVTGINFKPSNNVKVFYFSDTQNYTIDGKHEAGDRIYSTSNNTSNIWYRTGTAGTALTSGTANIATTTTGASTDNAYAPGQGWTAQ